MNAALDLAAGLTRAWTWTYTLGLAAALRDGRRNEIESDLWDQRHLAYLQRERSLDTARQVFLRCLLGIPADISWRAEAAFAAPEDRRAEMTETLASRAGLMAGIVFGLLPIAFGLSFLVEGSGQDWDAGWFIWGIGWIVAGAMIVAGLLQIRRTYGRGMTLVTIGVVGFAVSTFWMAFITLPLGIAIMVFAHFRGRGASFPPSPGTAA